MTEYERFGLVFTKTRVYKFGHRNRFPAWQPYFMYQPAGWRNRFLGIDFWFHKRLQIRALLILLVANVTFLVFYVKTAYE